MTDAAQRRAWFAFMGAAICGLLAAAGGGYPPLAAGLGGLGGLALSFVDLDEP